MNMFSAAVPSVSDNELSDHCTTPSSTGFHVSHPDARSDEEEDPGWVVVPPRVHRTTPPSAADYWTVCGTMENIQAFKSWRSSNSFDWRMSTASNGKKVDGSYTWVNYSCMSHVDCNAKVYKRMQFLAAVNLTK